MNQITQYSLNVASNYKDIEKNYLLEKSKDDKNIIRLKKDDKLIYLGSKYSVERDIEKLLNGVKDINVNTVIVVFGLGTGEHILKLMEEISETNKILIIEPDKNIISAFKEMSYKDKIIERDKNTLYLLNEKNMEFILASIIEDFNANNIKVVSFGNYEDIYENEFKIVLKKVNDCISNHLVNMSTYLVLAKECFEGYMKNLKFILQSSIINDFKDKFKDKPAIVVSAGPSLEKNIHLLKEVKDKFLIISGGRTLRPLLEIGVIPDIVCIIDPSGEYYDLMKNVLDKNIPLLYCEATSYRVVNDYTASKIFFREAIALGTVTNEILNLDIDTLWQGGSVAHICAALAHYLGCNPIIFIGQDFAYTGEKFHADIAKVQSVDADLKFAQSDYYVEDVYGEKVRTSRVLDGYKKYMEAFVKINPATKFINSTEGGANMEGTEVMSLQETIDKYAKDTFDKDIMKYSKQHDEIKKENVIETLKKVMDQFEKVKKSCDKGLEYSNKVEKLHKENKEIGNLLDKMNSINKSMNNMEIINHLLKNTMYKILMNPKFAEKKNETYDVVIERLVKQSKVLYEGVKKSIEKAEPIVEETIKELEE